MNNIKVGQVWTSMFSEWDYIVEKIENDYIHLKGISRNSMFNITIDYFKQIYTLKSEHHVYNAPMSGTYQIGDELVTLPAGAVVDPKKLTRAETWDSLYNPDLASKKEATCDHKWQNYVGFNDSYDFCTKCDEKRRT